MFRFATWVVGLTLIIMGSNYYHSVEQPDHEMGVAMTQFDNSDESAKELRKVVYTENQISYLTNIIAIGFTALCAYGPITSWMRKQVQNSGD